MKKLIGAWLVFTAIGLDFVGSAIADDHAVGGPAGKQATLEATSKQCLGRLGGREIALLNDFKFDPSKTKQDAFQQLDSYIQNNPALDKENKEALSRVAAALMAQSYQSSLREGAISSLDSDNCLKSGGVAQCRPKLSPFYQKKAEDALRVANTYNASGIGDQKQIDLNQEVQKYYQSAQVLSDAGFSRANGNWVLPGDQSNLDFTKKITRVSTRIGDETRTKYTGNLSQTEANRFDAFQRMFPDAVDGVLGGEPGAWNVGNYVLIRKSPSLGSANFKDGVVWMTRQEYDSKGGRAKEDAAANYSDFLSNLSRLQSSAMASESSESFLKAKQAAAASLDSFGKKVLEMQAFKDQGIFDPREITKALTAVQQAKAELAAAKTQAQMNRIQMGAGWGGVLATTFFSLKQGVGAFQERTKLGFVDAAFQLIPMATQAFDLYQKHNDLTEVYKMFPSLDEFCKKYTAYNDQKLSTFYSANVNALTMGAFEGTTALGTKVFGLSERVAGFGGLAAGGAMGVTGAVRSNMQANAAHAEYLKDKVAFDKATTALENEKKTGSDEMISRAQEQVRITRAAMDEAKSREDEARKETLVGLGTVAVSTFHGGSQMYLHGSAGVGAHEVSEPVLPKDLGSAKALQEHLVSRGLSPDIAAQVAPDLYRARVSTEAAEPTIAPLMAAKQNGTPAAEMKTRIVDTAERQHKVELLDDFKKANKITDSINDEKILSIAESFKMNEEELSAFAKRVEEVSRGKNGQHRELNDSELAVIRKQLPKLVAAARKANPTPERTVAGDRAADPAVEAPRVPFTPKEIDLLETSMNSHKRVYPQLPEAYKALTKAGVSREAAITTLHEQVEGIRTDPTKTVSFRPQMVRQQIEGVKALNLLATNHPEVIKAALKEGSLEKSTPVRLIAATTKEGVPDAKGLSDLITAWQKTPASRQGLEGLVRVMDDAGDIVQGRGVDANGNPRQPAPEKAGEVAFREALAPRLEVAAREDIEARIRDGLGKKGDDFGLPKDEAEKLSRDLASVKDKPGEQERHIKEAIDKELERTKAERKKQEDEMVGCGCKGIVHAV